MRTLLIGVYHTITRNNTGKDTSPTAQNVVFPTETPDSPPQPEARHLTAGPGAHLRGRALQHQRVQGDGGEDAGFAGAGLGLHDEVCKEPPQESGGQAAASGPAASPHPAPSPPLTQPAAPQRNGLQLHRGRPVEPSRLQPRQHRLRQQQRPEIGRAPGHRHIPRAGPLPPARRLSGRRHLGSGERARGLSREEPSKHGRQGAPRGWRRRARPSGAERAGLGLVPSFVCVTLTKLHKPRKKQPVELSSSKCGRWRCSLRWIPEVGPGIFAFSYKLLGVFSKLLMTSRFSAVSGNGPPASDLISHSGGEYCYSPGLYLHTYLNHRLIKVGSNLQDHPGQPSPCYQCHLLNPSYSLS